MRHAVDFTTLLLLAASLTWFAADDGLKTSKHPRWGLRALAVALVTYG